MSRWRQTFKNNVMNEDVRASKNVSDNLNTQEHIKKDSIKYFVKKYENYKLKSKLKL